MSSKFSGISKAHKPPAVCKAPPYPDQIPPIPFGDRYWQGWVYWRDSQGTDKVNLTETVQMIPAPITNFWEGTTAGEPYALRVEMTYHAPVNAVDLDVTLLLNASPVGSYQRLLIPIRSLDPFDTGLIDFTPISGPAIVQARIMS